MKPGIVLFCCAMATAAMQGPSKKGRIYGIAQDASGNPVAAAHIEIQVDLTLIATNEFWRQAKTPVVPLHRARSDSSGRFEIKVTPGRLYKVRFHKAGFKTLEVPAAGDRPFLALMTRGTDPAKNGAAENGGTAISGKIVDETGKALRGAVLRKAWDWDVLARSKADGSYVLARGKDDDVAMVFHPGYQIGVIPKLPTGPGQDPVHDVELKRGRAVSGRLIDASGKPVAGKLILIDSDILVSADHSYSAVPWTTKTDSHGRFVFRELAKDARYFVRTILDDGTPLEFGQGWAKQTTHDLGTFKTGPRTAFSGTVTWQDGKKLEDGFVRVLRLYDEKLAQWFVAREAPSYPIVLGKYRIPGLCEGRYELCFMTELAEPEVRIVTADTKTASQQLDVKIGRGRSFKGKVVDLDGKPIGGARLRALQSGTSDASPLVPPGLPEHNGRFLVGNVRVLTREDGSYLLERVRSYTPTRLIVIKEGYRTRTLMIEIGKVPPAVIPLERL